MKTILYILTFWLILSVFSMAETPVVKDTIPIIKDTNTVDIDSTTTAKPLEQVNKIIVYYFHGTRRCSNCIKFEEYSKEAIDSAFTQELKDGQMEWRMINIDEPENKHFINDYQLFTKSLILSKVVEGKEAKWKNLDKIWDLVTSKEKFIEYVQNEVKAYLKEE